MTVFCTRKPTDEERRLLAYLEEHGALLLDDSYQPSIETVGSCLAEGWAQSYADAIGFLSLSALGRRVLLEHFEEEDQTLRRLDV